MQFTVSEKCLICSKKFDWNEVIIIKAPEGACFHLDCGGKFPYDKVYDGEVNCWICTEYKGKEVWSKDN